MENNEVIFRGFQILNFEMKKRNDNLKEKNIEIKTTNFYNKKNKNIYKVQLSVIAISNSRNIKIDLEGLFEFSSNSPEIFRKKFLEITAPSVLYPYCRAFISNVTCYDAKEALILPVINFAKR